MFGHLIEWLANHDSFKICQRIFRVTVYRFVGFVFVICVLLLTTLNQDETNNFIGPYKDVLGAV